MKPTKVESDVTIRNPQKSSIIGTFKGKCADSIENNNSMLLDKDLWINIKNSDEFKSYRDKGMYIGFLGHPEDPGCQDFKNACIILRDLDMDESTGEVFGTFDLIDTPVGRIVKAFIDAGVQFGISVRGAGDVAADGYVDPDTFVFRGFDLVSFPAYDDAIPKFTALAASTDPVNVKKCNAVVTSLNDNLSKITSSSALDVVKSQLNPKSVQYKNIEARQVELAGSTIEASEVLQQKLEAMTQLYLAAVSANKTLKSQNAILAAKVAESDKTNLRLRRVNSATQRIMSEQLTRISASNQKTLAKHQQVVHANTQLKQTLENSNTQNLNYVQKVEAKDDRIRKKDAVIASLRSDLRKTVAENKELKSKPSNFDAKLKSLQKQIQASEKVIAEYQDAYAYLYATAIGAPLENISVTASTSVDELKSIISGGTSTANIPARPDVSVPVTIMDGDPDDDIVSL